ncbi:hypothetical protein [Algoriphagus sp. A40]|uniref:hypothetical protein n=1 Tax=Algoriphagus sp. A40 TaxID=1945863 RepID=UPI0009857165|nr:hypothetical protein [Algoriphagus sp. A40]OOG74939.1 hypothetical protein B0E43_11215 [Algoriphagus sp. A40]
METKNAPKKRVIVAFWKNRKIDSIEVFSNLKIFCETYPTFSYNTLNNYLGKAKTPYENSQLFLTRQELITKPLLKKARSIQPVVNRYLLASHDEGEQNLDFWLASEPESRIYAVTKLASEGMEKGMKVDKCKIQKLNMKD